MPVSAAAPCRPLREPQVRDAERSEPGWDQQRRASEVRDLDLRRAVWTWCHQDVGRFESLWRRSRACAEATALATSTRSFKRVHRDLLKPALRVRPFGKVEAGVFALNEVRRHVEVPLEQPNELRRGPRETPGGGGRPSPRA